MSISKAQASALADGFLDTLGDSDRTSLQPKNTLTELFLIAGELAQDMQDNLNKSNSVASGSLSKSIVVDEPIQSGTIVFTLIHMNFYGLFVNAGVKGLNSGRSTAGYSFKTPLPSEGMVKNLLAGIGRAKKSTSNQSVKKYGAYGKHETKQATTAFAKAFGAGVNIKKYGIQPTQFIDKAVIVAKGKTADRLGAALRVDIITSLSR